MSSSLGDEAFNPPPSPPISPTRDSSHSHDCSPKSIPPPPQPAPFHDFFMQCKNSRILDPYQLGDSRTKFYKKIVSGGAAHVFLVKINRKKYALKLFSYTYTGISRHLPCKEIIADSFTRECRAYAALIAHEINGKISPFCYGWLTVDGATENLLGRKFECFPILWDKHFSDDPDGNPPVRGILLEYIRGRTLDQIESISEELADQFRHSLQMIQDAGIHHADVKELNLKVEKGEKRAIWLDFSVSETLPLPPRLCFRPAAQTRDRDLLNDLLQKKMLKEMLLLCYNAKACGTSKKKLMVAAKARGMNAVTPRFNARHPANTTAPGTSRVQTSILKVMESGRNRAQNHKLKALNYKNKQIDDTTSLSASTPISSSKEQLQRHNCMENGPQLQESAERTTTNGEVARSEIDLEPPRLASLEDGD
ncbi:hypothetical protein RUND412_007961 [Rhizina undulata]